jgi:hypothetical protein
MSGVPWLIISGGWIGWWDLLALLSQLHLITITYNSANRWLPKARSIYSWTASVFSYTMIDLVLIHEPVTFSAFVVRWLTLHSWTLVTNKCSLLYDCANGDCLTNALVSERLSEWVILRPTVSRPVCQSVLVSSPHLGPTTISLLLLDNCGFVEAGRPLWREVGSVFYYLHFTCYLALFIH